MAETISQLQELVTELKKFTGVETVFGKPLTVGNFTLITAAEVAGGLGVGRGQGPMELDSDECCGCCDTDEAEETEPETDAEEAEDEVEIWSSSGEGAGGGTGGVSRPVGVIIVGESEVWVEPIIDKTRIGIAIATTVAAMGITLFKAISMAKKY